MFAFFTRCDTGPNARDEARRASDVRHEVEEKSRRRLRHACSAFSSVLRRPKCHTSANNPAASARHQSGNRNTRKAINWKFQEYAYRSSFRGPARIECVRTTKWARQSNAQRTMVTRYQCLGFMLPNARGERPPPTGTVERTRRSRIAAQC